MSWMRLALVMAVATLITGCAATVPPGPPAGMCCKKGEPLGIFLDNCLCEYEPCPEAVPVAVAVAPPTTFFVHYRVNHPCLQVTSRQEVDQAIDFMLKHPEQHATITGHTDGVGERAKQDWLSERRAKVVARYMIRKGVSADRLEVRGVGDAQPIASNQTEAGRAQNRRVEIVCTP